MAFFKVDRDIYWKLKYPQRYIYTDICSRINYNEPFVQSGVICGHEQCVVTLALLTARYCAYIHKESSPCTACKKMVRRYLSQMKDIIDLELVASKNKGGKAFRITLKGNTKLDTKRDTKVTTQVAESQRVKPKRIETKGTQKGRQERRHVLDYKELEYKNNDLRWSNISQEIFKIANIEYTHNEEYKNVIKIVEQIVTRNDLKDQDIIRASAQAQGSSPVKTSIVGWIQTAVAPKIKAVAISNAQRQHQAYPALPVREDQEEINTEGLKSLKDALFKLKIGGSDADEREAG